MRRRLSELTKANKNFESAILSCPKGHREHDCDKQDWQRSEEDFDNDFNSVVKDSANKPTLYSKLLFIEYL